MGSREQDRDKIRSRSSSRSYFQDSERSSSKSKNYPNGNKHVTISLANDSKCEYSPVPSQTSRRGSKNHLDECSSSSGFTDINGNEIKSRKSRTRTDYIEDSRVNTPRHSIDQKSTLPHSHSINEVELPRASRSLRHEEKNLNPFLDSRSPSRSREVVKNRNPFLESRSPSRSKSRSKERDLRPRTDESRSRSQSKSKVEPEVIQTIIPDSITNSIEGTPVILSREGSMIRIVDDETGEIFFKKRSKSKLRDYGGRIPEFIPRQSVLSFAILDEKEASVPTKSYLKSIDTLPEIAALKLIQVSKSPFMNEEGESNSQGVHVMNCLESPVPTKRSLGSKKDIISERLKQGILRNASSKSTVEYMDSSKRVEEVTSKLVEKKKERISHDSKSRSKDNKLPVASSDIENRNTELMSKTRSRSKSKSPDRVKSSGRKTKSQEEVGNEGNPFLHSSPLPSRRSRSRSDKRLGHERANQIPDEIFEQIFSYLSQKDLENTSRVCRRWKKLTDPSLRGPMLFKGKSFYGHYYPKQNCKKFVAFLKELEVKFYRPYEMQLRNAKDFQIAVVCKKLSHEFRSSVRHMVALQLENNCLKWKTLILLLQSFANLRSLSDSNSCHYSNTNPWGSCYRNKQNSKKEMKRQEFVDFKYNLKRLKSIKISRLTIDQELVIYIQILTQGARNVEEFELILGPWETCSKSNEDELCSSLQPFIKALNLFLFKNCKTLRILKFKWSDKNYIGYFQKCLDSLEKIEMPKLTEFILQFDKNSLKNPRNITKLRQFLEFHCAKSLRKVSISKLPLGESWFHLAMFINELMTQDLFSTVFNFEVILSDCFGLQVATAAMQIFRLQVFQIFTTHVHISIENIKTQSIAQLVGMQINDQYPRVNSVLVTFDPNGSKPNYPNFQDFSIDIITHNYPNLTQLRISDRLVAHQKMFNRVSGKSKLTGVSNAYLQNTDIQLICAILVNLKVLKLWVDLRKVDDHGITGINQGDILHLRDDDVNYTWNNFEHRLLPNFSGLQDLEELSLRGLGKGVTNLSAKFGFENMEQLNILELFGDMKISWKSRRDLRSKLKDNGTILRIKNS